MRNKKCIIIGFRVTKEMSARIEGEAKAFNLPVSWWLRGLVHDQLKKEDNKR